MSTSARNMFFTFSPNEIPIFDGEHFEYWIFQIETIFLSQELWSRVEEGFEETAGPNHSIGLALPIIDDAKTQLEAACLDVVSCADIVALAIRDSVVLTKGLSWAVPNGRRDGRVSTAFDTSNLPAPSESIASQTKKFSDLGLSVQDLVTIFGGHTIGTTACLFVTDRLYNFNNTSGESDSTISASFLPQLKALCPQNGDNTKRVDLDNRIENAFETTFFQSDPNLWTDASMKTFVQRFLGLRRSSRLNFNVEFGKSIVKIGNIRVKMGTNGRFAKFSPHSTDTAT